MTEVTYDGAYQNLHGVEMSRAYATALDISFDVRGGLFIRQVHHWAALLFMAAMSSTCSGSSSPVRSASRVRRTG